MRGFFNRQAAIVSAIGSLVSGAALITAGAFCNPGTNNAITAPTPRTAAPTGSAA